MQGLKAPLSQEDIQFFSQLDNLFEYDLKNAPAQGKFAQEEGIIVLSIERGYVCLSPKPGEDR